MIARLSDETTQSCALEIHFQVNTVLPPLNHTDESYRRRETGQAEPKTSNPPQAPVEDLVSAPAIDADAKAFRPPWRHPHLICPNCKAGEVNRVGRHGLGDHLRSMIYIYPFRCEACGHCFRVFEWGVRYRRQRRG